MAETALPLVRALSFPKVRDPKGPSGDLTNWERDPLSTLWVTFKRQAAFSRNDEISLPIWPLL